MIQRLKERFWLIVTLLAVVGCAYGCWHSGRQRFEASAREVQQGRTRTFADAVAKMRQRTPLCYAGLSDFPCWQQTTNEIREAVRQGVRYEWSGRITMLHFTFDGIGVTEAELASFERAQDEADIGRRYDDLNKIQLCADGSFKDCWKDCSPNDAPDEAKPRISKLNDLAVDARRLNITQMIFFSHTVDGKPAAKMDPLTADQIDGLRYMWANQCATRLLDFLRSYPEEGILEGERIADFHPSVLQRAIEAHKKMTSQGILDLLRDTKELDALTVTAAKRTGAYWVRWLEKGRKADTVVYPASSRWADNIMEWAYRSRLRLEDLDITSQELDRLRGEDPDRLPHRRVVGFSSHSLR